MEIQGRIIAVLPERSGVSARGEWKSQQFVIETHENFPKKMVFDVFGADRLNQFNIQSGEELTVSFDIDAHEYQGRWYNSIRAWNVQRVDPNAAASVGNFQPGGEAFPPAPAPMGASAAASTTSQATAPFPPASEAAGNEESSDDLPF